MASSSPPPPWSSLPRDVLSEILRRLPVIDRFRFRAVCRYWSGCCCASSLRQPYIGTYHPPGGRPQVPWLMAPVRRGTHHAFYDVASPSASFRMTHLPPIRFVAGTSPGGWVLHVDGNGDLHGLNVLTGEALRPPPLTAFSDVAGVERDSRGRISKYVLREPGVDGYELYWRHIMEAYYIHALIAFPEGGASRGRFVVAVIHGMFNDIAFAWEGDESWTDVKNTAVGYHHLTFYDGLIYAVRNNGDVLRFDPDGSTFEILQNPFRSLSGELRTRCHHGVNYLIELDGELWMVSRRYKYSRRPGRSFSGGYRRETITTPDVSMYKLDKLANIWLEMEGLGAGLALFLDHNQSLALSTGDFPQLRSGFLYLTDNFDESYQSRPSIRNIGAFDLEEKIFHVDYHWCLRLQSYPAPVWILR